MRTIKYTRMIALVVFSYSGLVPAGAAVLQVSNRAGLGGSVFDFSAFGGAGTAISTPDSRSASALTVEIGSSAGGMRIREEGADFTGNFAKGDTLLSLYDYDRSDTFIISFPNTAVFGLGAQVQPVSGYLGNYTAYLDLYSASNALLGEVTVTGTAGPAEDNSAPFLGALSTSDPVSYALFSDSIGYPGFSREGDVAINRLSVVTTRQSVNAIPEPTALAPFCAGLLGIAWSRRRPKHRF